jgi:hypothetical protein
MTTDEMMRLVRWTLKVKDHIPRKYSAKVDRLFNAYREVLYTHRITIAASELALHWRCAVADLPTLLYRMTCRSKGRVTYRIGPGTLGLGTTIQLRFAVQEGGTHDVSTNG